MVADQMGVSHDDARTMINAGIVSNPLAEEEEGAGPTAPPAPATLPGPGGRPQEACMYGVRCYNTNPDHLAKFSHPATAIANNTEGARLRAKIETAQSTTTPPPPAGGLDAVLPGPSPSTFSLEPVNTGSIERTTSDMVAAEMGVSVLDARTVLAFVPWILPSHPRLCHGVGCRCTTQGCRHHALTKGSWEALTINSVTKTLDSPPPTLQAPCLTKESWEALAPAWAVWAACWPGRTAWPCTKNRVGTYANNASSQQAPRSKTIADNPAASPFPMWASYQLLTILPPSPFP
jgi:hypothetical protein